jgi:hypothetical protein
MDRRSICSGHVGAGRFHVTPVPRTSEPGSCTSVALLHYAALPSLTKISHGCLFQDLSSSCIRGVAFQEVMERKIALCVGNWNSDSTLFSWTYVKRYFLRVSWKLLLKVFQPHVPRLRRGHALCVGLFRKVSCFNICRHTGQS